MRDPTHHVKANVNQYIILHATVMTLSGSHNPLAPSVSVPDEDARSIGTRRMILLGSASARNTGTNRYAGVNRSGRYCLNTRSTKMQMMIRAKMVAISDGTEEAAMVC